MWLICPCLDCDKFSRLLVLPLALMFPNELYLQPNTTVDRGETQPAHTQHIQIKLKATNSKCIRVSFSIVKFNVDWRRFALNNAHEACGWNFSFLLLSSRLLVSVFFFFFVRFSGRCFSSCCSASLSLWCCSCSVCVCSMISHPRGHHGANQALLYYLKA